MDKIYVVYWLSNPFGAFLKKEKALDLIKEFGNDSSMTIKEHKKDDLLWYSCPGQPKAHCIYADELALMEILRR